MKKMAVFTVLLSMVYFNCSQAVAIGIEAAVGGQFLSPSGFFSYKGTGELDNLDIDNDLKYDNETNVYTRVKIDMPLVFPNIYLMATPVEFEATGINNINFKFGDLEFNEDEEFYSKLNLSHYDVTLYYSIPFLGIATLNRINIDLGINVRVIDFKAEMRQETSNLYESKDAVLPVPMIYAAIAVGPVKDISLEAEIRGISYGNNSYYSVLGRIKYEFPGPLFIAGGYRYDEVKIDEDDIDIDLKIQGVFFESGVSF